MKKAGLYFTIIAGFIAGWMALSRFLKPDNSVQEANLSAPSSILNQRQTNQETAQTWLITQLDSSLPEFERLRHMALNDEKMIDSSLTQTLVKLFRKTPRRDRPQLLQEALRGGVANDPLAALKACRALVEKRDRNEALHAWAQQLAHLDPERALEIIRTQFPPSNKDRAMPVIRAVTEVIGRRQPAATFALMKEYGHFPGEGLASIAQIRPEAAAKFLFDTVGDQSFEGAATLLFRQWTLDDADRAIHYYQDLTASQKTQVLEPFMNALAEADPHKAAALWESDTLEAQDLLYKIGFEWAEEDATASLTWAEDLPNAKSRVNAIKGMFHFLSRSHPERTWELIQNYPELDGQTEDLFRVWAQKHFESAYAATAEITDSKVRATAISGMIRQIESDAPHQLEVELDWLASLGDQVKVDLSDFLLQMDGRRRSTLFDQHSRLLQGSVSNVLEQASWLSPERAVEIASSLPDSRERDKGLQRGIAKWAETAPQTAAEWVALMPEGEGRDYASINLVNNWSRYDPQGAMNWIRSLENEQQQQVAVEEFVRTYAMRDGAAAWELTNAVANPNAKRAMQALTLSGWAETSPSEAATALAEMPSIPAELQSAYDEALATAKHGRPSFTPQQQHLKNESACYRSIRSCIVAWHIRLVDNLLLAQGLRSLKISQVCNRP